MDIKIIKITDDVSKHVYELADLRIKVFREYPYLYDGDYDYEKKYLQTYLDCKESTIVLALDGESIVGASTAIPLAYETEEVKEPFLRNNLDINSYFYFGESILLPKYRGKGVYKHFFQEGEQTALLAGFYQVAFCAVDRSPQDPKRPVNYKSLEPIWSYFGYQKQMDISTYFDWKETDESEQSSKKMIFWLKTI